MKVNQQKVIVLDKNERESDSFACPCEVCLSKNQQQQMMSETLHEVNNIISDLMETTSFVNKDFQVQVSYSGQPLQVEKEELDLLHASQISVKSEIRPTLSLVKDLSKFVTTFKKKYRHVLICELEECLAELTVYLSGYQSKAERNELVEVQLWELQNIVIALNSIDTLTKHIQEDGLLDQETTSKLREKAVLTRSKQIIALRQLFNQALEIPEFQPQCTPEDLPSYYSTW
jgi:hypothetical protein